MDCVEEDITAVKFDLNSTVTTSSWRKMARSGYSKVVNLSGIAKTRGFLSFNNPERCAHGEILSRYPEFGVVLSGYLLPVL